MLLCVYTYNFIVKQGIALSQLNDLSTTGLRTCAPGLGKDIHVSTRQALLFDVKDGLLLIMTQARVLAMFGYDSKGIAKENDVKSDSTKNLAEASLKNAEVIIDEVQTLSMWTFPAALNLPTVLQKHCKEAVIVAMTATSVFTDANKERYFENTLKLKDKRLSC